MCIKALTHLNADGSSLLRNKQIERLDVHLPRLKTLKEDKKKVLKAAT